MQSCSFASEDEAASVRPAAGAAALAIAWQAVANLAEHQTSSKDAIFVIDGNLMLQIE